MCCVTILDCVLIIHHVTDFLKDHPIFINFFFLYSNLQIFNYSFLIEKLLCERLGEWFLLKIIIS